ncbi:MAG TPA: hypothetical protein PLQ13_06225, partial [Candidatus Krumholzibacteria bacterium]|nr:hypothetical protein [Candidatus Krumholzibacteria bacterium]
WSSDRGGNMEIWMAAADGSGARQVSRDGADAENPTMSADGAWITYASGDERKMGIWKIRPDGSDAVRLLAGPYLLPEISPDGQHVLCVSNRDLDYVVSVIRLEDGSRVDFEIVISPFERQEDVMFGRARWTPDGRGILYVGQDAQGHSGIYVQDFVPGQDTAAGRRPLAGFSQRYATESLGISPDGRSLAFAVTDEQRTIKVVDGLDLSDWR